jgi:FlaA1/EpsC-like NDP-sugar epimerase
LTATPTTAAGLPDRIHGKRILVTGACGTVGRSLVRQLLQSTESIPAEVVGIDNAESPLFFVEQDWLSDPRASFRLADIRDRDAMVEVMQGIDVVFHTAALKHVILCERAPYEAVQTNILGVNNLVHAAKVTGPELVLFTSSDKAVNPTNVMGTSKLMGERLMTAANACDRDCRTIFASTRFGNVLGSNGSVIPIFRRQILAGGPVTLTDPDMTRFVMSIEEAVALVIRSCAYARGGEVFITKMPVIRIEDLAAVMIEELSLAYARNPRDVRIEVIGSKPGEKLYEELMSDEETRRAVELPDFFSVLPAFRGIYGNIDYSYPGLVSDAVTNPYVSARETVLSRDELRHFLHHNGLLHESGEDVAAEAGGERAIRYWPGDKESMTSPRR